ncbi:glutamate-1-semialdehyde 2,1-aminomutase [Hydrogenoanaerobacterium sp.]|uniref:glutamate-1-semialdehyde 2,1-aminomutase n=1 Tax=Hydrogenoanaerobacterium sp. TaxID=2953763 RepID=UPI00289DE66D|nr:glutamate-1-semialdehyde 2,1-aminomutase [Hydrogenoanaerobacterium sp.]
MEHRRTRHEKSRELFREAQQYIPGGVNSPVRAFRSVGGTPRFMESANGARITDADGRTYLDYICSWGPMVLGHNHPAVKAAVLKAVENGLSFGAATEAEVTMAHLICDLVPSIDMVRMVNSGTEAVMSAIRAARGYTGRAKIIKFEGCYHGHFDALLVKAGSGVMTAGVPDSAGVPKGTAEDTLTAVYNDINSVQKLFEDNKDEVAAVIIEPVAANMGVVLPKDGFLAQLRELCTANKTLLIFDEVITGFRLGIDGAQGWFGVKPDLTTFGKIIGGGMPVGAYGGRHDVMQMIAPIGNVYQAGTLSGNPVAMAAGIAQLKILRDNPEIYRHINTLGDRLYGELEKTAQQHGCTVNHIGSLGCVFFTEQTVTDYTTAKQADTVRFGRYFKKMLGDGIYLAPSQFEAMFLSYAHTDADIDFTVECAKVFLKHEYDGNR